jgi:hypothetical protein
MKISFFLLALFAFIGSGCGTPSTSKHPGKLLEAPNLINNPHNFNPLFETLFKSLPLQGKLDTQPWSDSYWPDNHGGTAWRWNAKLPSLRLSSAWSYELLTLEKLRAMSADEISQLSPAEKLDIFTGDFYYPNVRLQRYLNSPTALGWEGICNGWAPASLNFIEPQPVTVTSKDGIVIPFGASDIKALLSQFQTFNGGGMKLIGERCGDNLTTNPASKDSRGCRDTNAGSFHIVVANYLGIQKKGFVFDLTRDEQIWNQPAFGFQSRVLGWKEPSPTAAVGTVQEVTVETILSYGNEIHPTWASVVGTSINSIRTVTYQYNLELDAKGHILGGEWLNYDRPDFLWMVEKPVFSGNHLAIETIYQESLKAHAPHKSDSPSTPTP